MTLTAHELLAIGMPDPDEALLHVWRSALVLAPHTAATCTDAYHLHQLVERGLGLVATTGNRNGRSLYTAARNPSTNNPRNPAVLNAGRPHTLLVQSPAQPDWAPLLANETLTNARTQHIQQTWKTGDTADIRTLASPVVTRNNDHGDRRRLTLTDPQDCGTWLATRLRKAGCVLENHHITMNAPERVHVRDQPLTLRQFHATVTITNPHAFTTMLTTGLGHHRAWGAGLVLARPTNPPQQA